MKTMKLVQYYESGGPEILQTFRLAQVAEAHRLLESRVAYGKIILCP